MESHKHFGKYKKGGVPLKKSIKKKRLILTLSIVLVLSLAVGGTLAYIAAKTDNVENQFERAYVTCQVNANDNGTFDVTNTGNVDAYIRAAIVVNWMDSSGNVRGIAPASTDYKLGVNHADWWHDPKLGYYYYKYSVIPTGVTEDLVTSISVNDTVPSDYELSVEVVAEAIQADGDTDNGAVPAYQDAWGIASIGS